MNHPVSAPVLQTLLQTGGGRPVAACGTAINPGGTINTFGSYANLGVISSTDDTTWLELLFNTVGVAGSSRCTLCSVGIDPAGGTTFTDKISDLIIGSPGPYTDGTAERFSGFTFPLRIPAGASLGIRAKQNNASPSATIRCAVRAAGKSSHPELDFAGNVVESIGVANAATCQGTAITPGTTAEGAWTLLGTNTRRLRYLDFGYALDNTNVTSQGAHVDIAYGDGTTFVPVITDALVNINANEFVFHGKCGAHCNIPPGSSIYARSQLLAGTVDATQSIAVYGVA